VLGPRRTQCNSFKPDWSGYQEAQLSQRDRTTLRHIKNLATGDRDVQGHWKWRRFDRSYTTF